MKNRRLILIGYIFALLITLVPSSAGAAGEFRYDTRVTYRIESDGAAMVSELYTITNQTSRQYLSEMVLSTPVKKLSGLSVKYQDGAAIPATVSVKNSTKDDIDITYQEIRLRFPRANYGQGRSWSFYVNYQAEGMLDTQGSARTVYIPSIEGGQAEDTYEATLNVPLAFGTPHFAGAKSSSGGVLGDRQIYVFNKEELSKQSLSIVFGDRNTYKLNFNFPLHNASRLPKTLTVALPPDLGTQKVRVLKMEPAPSGTRLDEDGNILADYKLSGGQRLNVVTEVLVEARYLEYDLAASGTGADIPADLAARYTTSTAYWPTSGSVAAEAAKLVKADAPVIANVEAIYRYVIDKLSYNQEKIKFNVRQGADKALANPGNAVCLEYSDLMVAMLRSAGIPARMPVGYGYTGSLKSSKSVADSLHSWVEAYVPGIGWMSFDPTWGEKFDQFGRAGLDHVAFAIWGSQDSLPAPTMQGTRDLGYQYEQAKLSYLASPTKVQATGKVALAHYSLLPFISFQRITVVGDDQTATDANRVSLGDGPAHELGSLAPDQQVSLQQFTFGGAWLKPISVSYGRGQAEGALVLGAATAQPNYLPVLIIALACVAYITWRMVRLRASYQETEPENVPPPGPEL